VLEKNMMKNQQKKEKGYKSRGWKGKEEEERRYRAVYVTITV
jgi:hypothetical protein